MELRFENNIYYITCEYGERDLIKQAGFKWCSIKKMWATNNFYIAAKAVKDLGIDDFPEELDQYFVNYERSYADKPATIHNHKYLLDFQAAGVEEVISRKNILIADEQGLGKTIQSIAYLETVDVSTKVIIICQASVKINWAREFKKWINKHAYIVRTNKDRFPKDASVILVNYDLLKSKIILDQLLTFGASLLVCDEIQYLKNAKTKRYKAVAKIASIIPKKIFLSGTPLLNRPIEVYPVLKILSPKAMYPYQDYRNFAYRFCNAYNSKWGFDVSGNSNEDELNFRLRSTCMIRRLKADVMKQLPDKTKQIIAFETDAKSNKIIEKTERFFVEDLVKWPERGSMGEIAEARHELALLKLEESVRYIKDLLESVDKIVVFAHHHDVLNGLKEYLAEYNPAIITGRHSAPNRQKAVDDFQTKPEVRVFIGQLQAAGSGITLTAASTVVFVETSWVPGEINQAIDRCHRIGQKDNVTARFLVVEKSLDETMLKTIFDKEKIINKILR